MSQFLGTGWEVSAATSAGGSQSQPPFFSGRMFFGIFFNEGPGVWLQLRQRKQGGKEISGVLFLSDISSSVPICNEGVGLGKDAVNQTSLSIFF